MGFSMHERSSVLLFVKYPEKGKVKTRLASKIGDDAALAVYQELVSSMLDELNKCRYPRRIYFTPMNAKDNMGDWIGTESTYVAQSGSDVGERMKNAFLEVFETGVERALLIGSDVPDITVKILDEAMDSLERNDVVIGPAMDGGYYLVGFNARSLTPEIFDNIMWSTSTVYEKTLEILRGNGQRVHCLQELRDIDTLDDLEEYLRKRSVTGKGSIESVRCHVDQRSLSE
jgi:rSAM/selenodomain-associated transferase 1